MSDKDKPSSPFDSLRHFLTESDYSSSAEDVIYTRGGLFHYREMAYRYALMALAVLLVPVMVSNIQTENYQFLWIELVLELMAIQSVFAKLRGHTAILTAPVYVLATVGLVAQSLYQNGTPNLYWVFPMLLLIHFMLNRRWAAFVNIFLVAVVSYYVVDNLETMHFRFFLLSILSCSGIVIWFFYILEDQERALRDIAVLDPLTGAFNRRRFDLDARSAVGMLQRYEQPTSVLMLDMDHFKKINDKYGHDVGDIVLCSIVKLVRGIIRELDGLYRYGGEEFVVLLPNTTAPQAAIVAENLRVAIEESELLKSYGSTASFGVSALLKDEVIEECMKRCDEALYQAKNEGRNRVVQAS
jgi:diguanylate cyclase (GGDEF)-like protein